MENSSNNHPAFPFFRSFFKDCYPKACINLRFIQKDETVIGNKFIPISKLNHIPQILDRYKDVNSYFGIATRGDGFGGKDGVVEIPYVWVDIDRKDFAPEEWGKLTQKIKEFPLRPAWVIDSGGGLHVYWKLRETLSEEDTLKVEDVLKRLANHFDGDSKPAEVAHVLRIPFTQNVKYDPPRAVSIVESNETAYDISDFDFLPSVSQESPSAVADPISASKGTPLSMNFKKPNLNGWHKELMGGLGEGQRNISLAKLAGRYTEKGLSKEEFLPILLHVNKKSNPPLSEKQVDKIADSVIRTHKRNHSGEESVAEDWDLKVFTLEDISDYPEPKFIIEKVLLEESLGVIGGIPGLFKSILALSFAKAILTGEDLWGKFKVLKKGPVLIIDEENPRGLLKDRLKKLGLLGTDLPLHFIHFQGLKIDNDKHFNHLTEKIKEIKPVLVIIDSFVRVHGQKEDDASAMRLVMSQLRKIANLGTTVLLIHHHRKGEAPLQQRLRGSGDIPAGIDIEYAVISKDINLIEFCSVKTRVEPLGAIKLRVINEDDKLNIVYEGSEDEEILQQVKSVLAQRGRQKFPAIKKVLESRKFPENKLRKVLAKSAENSVKTGIYGRQLKREKGQPWVFWTRKEDAIEGDRVNRLPSDREKED
jgi:hypothetical protein